MDDYEELIERLRDPYQYEKPIDEAANAIESLIAENDRLKHNLATTEQTMREYQELAAKRLEEIAKYRDAPVVAWHHEVEGLSYENHYVGNIPLIVKPGEEK